jgi:serine/threonine protein kinase
VRGGADRNLDHRNIIKLYAVTERKKYWVLVMEFAEQGSLHCHGHSTLTKLRIAIEIVEALHFLHSRKPPVLHRGTLYLEWRGESSSILQILTRSTW